MDSKRIQSFLNPLCGSITPLNYNSIWKTLCNRSSYPQTYTYQFYDKDKLLSALADLEEESSEDEEKTDKKETITVQCKSVEVQTDKEQMRTTRTIGTQYNKDDVDVDWIVVPDCD
mgnify:FL=1